ncbi:AEC family transporter [Pseudorhodoferax sp.]|uniref:AEC family transporter n=1 Tax=Pseudorhodoferax sp. TaxID=1993553 RepID=UPI0039E214C5
MIGAGGVLAATAPIYLLILAGFLVVRYGVFTQEQMRVLGRFATLVALPALLFRALSSRPLGDILNPRYLLAYGAGSLAVLASVWWWARRRRREGSAKSALLALGMSNSNSAFIGYPVASQLVGGATAGVGLALTMLIENLLIMPAALAAADADGDAGGSLWMRLRAIAGRLVRNPLIIAIAVGLAVTALDIEVPDVLQRTVGVVAAAASPLALFVIGGALVGLRPGGMLGDVATVALGKLLLHPAAVLAASLLLPMDPLLQRAAVVYASVPMLSIYPVLAQKYGLDSLAAAALLAATTLSFLTINLWMAWL